MRYGRREWRTVLKGRPLEFTGLTSEPPVFIVGSGRCGTTLLRAILITSQRIHIPPETHVLGGIIDEYRVFSRLPWSFVVRQALSRLEFQPNFDMFEVSMRPLFRELLDLPPERRSLAVILNSIYMYHARLRKPSATRWGDKTPGNAFCLKRLMKVFPDMKVIHMLRDGRDVVRSFTEMQGGLSLDVATERWISTIRRLRAFTREHGESSIEVRYENLVSNPERELRRVCDFIQLEFESGMLRHNERGSRSIDIATYSHYQNVLRPISSQSIGRWQSAFDKQTVDRLNLRMGALLSELGYR
jgi:hypothetical protein